MDPQIVKDSILKNAVSLTRYLMSKGMRLELAVRKAEEKYQVSSFDIRVAMFNEKP
jgi:hypothetical protein